MSFQRWYLCSCAACQVTCTIHSPCIHTCSYIDSGHVPSLAAKLSICQEPRYVTLSASTQRSHPESAFSPYRQISDSRFLSSNHPPITTTSHWYSSSDNLLTMRLSKSLLLFLSTSGVPLSSAFYIPGESRSPLPPFTGALCSSLQTPCPERSIV